MKISVTVIVGGAKGDNNGFLGQYSERAHREDGEYFMVRIRCWHDSDGNSGRGHAFGEPSALNKC